MNPVTWLRDRRPHRIYYGWWVVAASSLMMFVAGGILFRGAPVFFVPVRDSLRLNNIQTSLVFALSRAVFGVGPVVGWLIDRYGPRKLIVAGALLSGLGFLSFSFANNLLWFALAYIGLASLGSSIAFQHALWALLNMWFIRRRAFAMSFNGLAPALGGVALIPILNAIIIRAGWEWAAVFASFMYFLVVLPMTLIIRNSPESIGLLPDGDLPQAHRPTSGSPSAGHVGEPPATQTPADYSVSEALRTPAYWFMLLGICLRWMAMTGILVNMQPILIWKGVSQETVGYLFSLMLGINVVATIAIGRIADSWPKPLVLAALPISEGIALLVLMWSSWQSAAWAIVLYVMLQGVGESVVFTTWAAVGAFFGRYRYASLRGIITFSGSWGIIVSPVFVGWWADRSGGDYGVPLWISVALLGAAALCFAIMGQPRRPIAVGAATSGTVRPY